MISLGGIGGDIEKAGHDVGSVGEQAANKLKKAGEKIASGLEEALIVSHEVGEAADEIDHASEDLARGADKAFHDAVQAGDDAFEAVKQSIEHALHEAEEKLLEEFAKVLLHDLEPALEDLRSIWPKLRSDLSSEFETLAKSAAARDVTDDTKAALRTIAKTPAFARFLEKHLDHAYASFGFEFDASAAAGVGASAAVGVLAGLPNVTDIKGFGTVGVSLGASLGANLDEALLIYSGSPSRAAGPAFNVIFSLDVEVGGTVAVSFDLPKFEFLGFTIGLGEGDEASIALGSGYTFVF